MDLTIVFSFLISGLILAVAVVHSAAGLAGSSGYLAVMALFGRSPIAVKPTILTLNIIVALISVTRFYRAGFFSWRTFWPFAAGSAPASLLAGSLTVPHFFHKSLVILIILYGAARLFFRIGKVKKTTLVPIWIALSIGVAIGSITGLTGVGGGIFLSPLLLLMHWARREDSCGVSAAFVLVNSVAALLPNVSALLLLPNEVVYWAPAALVGGWIGTEIGLRGLPIFRLRPFLAVLLIVGALRSLISG